MTSYADFMARAYTMELEATERYALFADQLETHNNTEVAQVFRKLSDIEALHAKQILSQMNWPSLPAVPVAFAWEGEAPETAPFESVHYLMQPYHALEIALHAEMRAQNYYETIAREVDDATVRAAALELAAEEAEHVALIRDWMRRVPQPPLGWDQDPDPARVTE
jgi:rubrerythrin